LNSVVISTPQMSCVVPRGAERTSQVRFVMEYWIDIGPRTSSQSAGIGPNLSDENLVSENLGGWLSGDGALYAKLAQALRTALLRGDIPPGTSLPPERTLAQTLSVSRTTVVGAYRVLRDEGWLESRQGSGHVVRHPGHDEPVPYAKADVVEAIARNPLMRPAAPHASGVVDFSASRQASIGPLLRQISQSTAEDLDELAGQPGYVPLGLPALRSAVARYCSDLTGVVTTPEQVLITSGSQQAIWLIGQLYAPFGERVLLENPTYAGAIDAFRMIGARIEPLPVTEGGFQIDQLSRLLTSGRPRLVLVSPTCQAPTGLVMPDDQRARFVELIDQHQVTTIEDQTMLDLLVDSPRPLALASLSSTAPILSIGSLSKLFWPGLRIGWVRGPEPIIDHLSRLKGVVDLGGSPIVQRMAVELLEHVESVRGRTLASRLGLAATLWWLVALGPHPNGQCHRAKPDRVPPRGADRGRISTVLRRRK
jgi:DNA-binding transcriptional MocR family regulator